MSLLESRALRAIALLLLLLATAIPCSAFAQGGGMGGMGGRSRGGGRGGRSGGEAPGQRGASSGDVAKQMEELASLDRALDDVPDLNRQEKDSLKAIEASYAKVFKSYAIAARNKVDSARAAGGTPDLESLRTLRLEADSVRTTELSAARAVLISDAQRARFDRNVADIVADEAKRQEESRNRREGGMRRGTQ